MIHNDPRRTLSDDKGFTLIELLVVVVGVLAAIAVPRFLNQRQRAREATAKADAATIAKSLVSYYVDGRGALQLDDSVVGQWRVSSPAGVDLSGHLSKSNRILDQRIVSDEHFCIVVVSYPGDRSSPPDKPWRYDEHGLAQAASC